MSKINTTRPIADVAVTTTQHHPVFMDQSGKTLGECVGQHIDELHRLNDDLEKIVVTFPQ